MFERFTDRARRAVVAAQEEARLLGHDHIGSEHLLLGLLHEQGGTASQALEAAGITLDAARAQVREQAGGPAGPGGKSPSGHIPFTRHAKRVLELSLREALEQKSGYIGTEHILLGLMRDSDGAGARILERLGGPLSALRQRVLDTAKSAAPGPAPEGAPETTAGGGPQSTAGAEGGSGSGAAAVAATRVWRVEPGPVREAFVRPQTALDLGRLLRSADRRLAAIERHFGIATEDRGAPGYPGLLASIGRRLAAIERHLGLPADEEPAGTGTDEPPAEAEPDEPSADAE